MRRKRSRPARTVIEFAVARGGIVKGSRVTRFVMQWTIASEQLGRPIGIEEYIEWWGESRTTAYRHQREFRECFPELSTPQAIANRAIAKQREKIAEKGMSGVRDFDVSSVVGA